jgi:hypothetical protein
MFVRNPWDWYVSWYHFLQELYARQAPEVRNADPVYRSVLGRGRHDFATAVRLAGTTTRSCAISSAAPRIGSSSVSVIRSTDYWSRRRRYPRGFRVISSR